MAIHPRQREALGLPRLQLKLGNWPATDQQAWESARAQGDILSSGAGVAADWRPATVSGVLKAYGRWLAWLASQENLETNGLPGDRVNPRRVASYVDYLHEHTSSATAHQYVCALAMALSAMAPDADVEWLWRIVRRLKKTSSPVKQKVDRLVPVRDIFALGCRLMNEAEAGRINSPSDIALAIKYRNGLMISLLAARPIRLRNLQAITIGRHLTRAGARYYLRFEADETKTRKALEFILPAELETRLHNYILCWRPALIARGATERTHATKGLWISMFGNAMSCGTIQTTIAHLTQSEFGKSITPHLFRDCAATSIALEDPAHVAITASILGHSTLSTSERYYNHALNQKAADLHQHAVLAMRKAAKKANKAGRRLNRLSGIN